MYVREEGGDNRAHSKGVLPSPYIGVDFSFLQSLHSNIIVLLPLFILLLCNATLEPPSGFLVQVPTSVSRRVDLGDLTRLIDVHFRPTRRNEVSGNL